MESRYKIFIVEDNKDLLNTLTIILEDNGFQVDGAATLAAALDLLNRKTYHVALVDINLAGAKDTMNEDGLKVLERLTKLGEGTKAIVLTGQRKPQFAADIMMNYQVSDYIDKDLIIYDKEPLLSKVQEKSKSCNVILYGMSGKRKNLRRAIEFLSMDDPTWVTNTLMLLKIHGGYDSLKDFVDRFCEPLAPLMPKINISQIMELDNDKHLTYGEFWSKGIGAPVALLFCRNDENQQLASSIKPNWEKEPLYNKSAKIGIRGVAYKLTNVDRDAFVEILPQE